MNKLLLVRKFRKSDAGKVKNLVLSILEKDYPLDLSAYPNADLDNLSNIYSGPRNTFMVIKKGLKIVGTAGIIEEDSHTALLRRLFVDPNYRRKGYGSALIDRAIKFCRKMHYHRIVFRTTSRMKEQYESAHPRETF